MLIRTPHRSLATITAALLGLFAHAQENYPLSITVVVLPPYSPSISSYFSNSEAIAFTITNPTTTTYQVYLAGWVRSEPGGEISATVEGGQPWSAPSLTVTPGGNYFTGETLLPILSMINGNPATVVGLDETQLRLGVIPEGTYELCLQVFDYLNPEVQLSNTGCRDFTVREGEPPVPLAPTCWDDGTGEMVTPQTPQFINFVWMLPFGAVPGVTVSYAFRLVRIDNPSNAQAALETSTDVVYEEEVFGTQLAYTQMMPALEPGRMYAWWVRAIPFPASGMLIRNDGYMSPCTFTYDAHRDTDFGFSYPAQQDTLPWDLMPIMARFEPHAPAFDDRTTGKFWSRLEVFKDGAFLNRTYRHTETNEIDWADGYYVSQKTLLNNPPDFTEEQARHINVYTNNPTAEGRFKRGSTYSLSADLRTKDRAGMDVRYGDAEGRFVSGMGLPRPLSPVQNAVLQKNGGDTTITGFARVQLRFQTAEAPLNLRPPFPIRILYGTNAPTQTQGTAHERWRVDVSRSPTMSDPITTGSRELGPVQLLNDACDDACFAEEFYRLDSIGFLPPDTGTFYWRVSWMKDPESAEGATYHEGPVRKFRVVVDSPPPPEPEEEEVRPRECVSICRAEPTPIAQRVPVMDAAVNDTVSVGLFNMRITSITWAGGSASGEGLIPVPFMNCPMKVAFSNAQINAAKVLYTGEVLGLYDNETVVPAAWRMGAGLAAGFSPIAVQTVDDYLNATGRLAMQMNGTTPMGLPIGIATDVPGGRFTIGIVGMQFTDSVAKLNAMMSVPVPELGFNYGLGVSEQVFQPDGVGCPDTDAMLYLVDDVRVDIGGDTLVLRSTKFEAGNYINVVDSGTYVLWDCRGFRALQLDAQWRFSPDHLREDLTDGSSGPDKIIASLKTRTGRGGLMGRVDFNKPFHIDGGEGWGFAVQEAWLDLASYANPPEMSLSPEVSQRVGLMDANGVSDPTWRGFYLKRAMLRLPDGVKRFGSTERVTALVDNMVVHNSQLTASFKLASLIGVNEGDLAGWAISVDTLQLDIVANSFSQAVMKGRMRTAVSATLLDYSALWRQNPITSDDWIEFLIEPQDDVLIPVPFLAANLLLEETSTVLGTIGHEQTGTYAKATLNGSLTLASPPSVAVAMNFSGVAFENLQFMTLDPLTNINTTAVFSLASPQKFMGGEMLDDAAGPTPAGGSGGGFPVSITRVTGERTTIDGKPAAGIAYDINVKLSDATNIFLATTRVATLGVLNTTQIHQWGDTEMRLDSIGVSGGTGAVHVTGGANWYRDSPTFGNGIKGKLRAQFFNRRVEVLANAQFGTVGSNKYWYVDAMAAKEGGFNKPSAFTIYGFGGAAWYHMRQTGSPPLSSAITEQEMANLGDPNFEPGLTLSGLSFTPDPAVGFGFKATIAFGDPSTGNAYNGDVSAGAQFTSEGGLLNIFLDGNMQVMHKRGEEGHIPVRGNGRIAYDFPNDVFSANFEMFVHLKASSGVDVLYGNGNNKRAGALELVITPDTWHIYVGNPVDRVGLTFVDFISGGFYIMLGDDLPSVPSPPVEVASLVPLSMLVRDDISDASGIAFGAAVPLATKNKWLVFGYHVVGEIGFDLMFRSSAGMECLGETNPGIGPFYVNGQLYGFMDAAVSITVDFSIFNGEYHLFEVGLAGLFQCGFANPSWLNGFVHGSYNILHGMVSGSITLPFSAGKRCTSPNQDLLNGLNPIGGLSPADLSGLPPSCSDAKVCGVDCGTMPEAVFNMKVDNAFTMHEMSSSGSWVPRTFKLEIEHFELRKKIGNTLVAGTTTIAANKEMATLGPNDYLAPNTEFTVSIKLRALELKTSGWVEVKKDNVPVTWMMKHAFKTNTGIEELKPENVAWSYPFYRQRFLLQDECRNGVIDCKGNLTTQPVFQAPQGRRREYRVIFVPLNGGALVERDAEVAHTATSSEIRFPIPTLQNSRTYTLKVVARDVVDASTMGTSGEGPAPSGGFNPQSHAQGLLNTQVQNTGIAVVSSSTTTMHAGMVNIRKQSLQGYTLRSDEKLIYEYQFRTSQHNTLSAKAAALANSGTTYLTTTHVPARETLEPAFTGEGFDTFEAKGLIYTRNTGRDTIPPMVFLTAANTDNWMANWAKPVLYDYYGLIKSSGCSDLQIARTTNIVGSGLFSISVIRDTPDHIGIPPYRTVRFHPNALIWNPLSDSEAAPSISYGVPGAASGINTVGDGSSGNQTILQVTTGVWTRDDYIRLKTITNDVILNCGPLNPVIDGQGEAMGGIGEPLRSKVVAFQNGYRRMYKGNYRTTMRFIPPPTCPFSYVEQGDEVNAPGSMGDAVYSHPLGATPPIPGANPVPGGGGIIQN